MYKSAIYRTLNIKFMCAAAHNKLILEIILPHHAFYRAGSWVIVFGIIL